MLTRFEVENYRVFKTRTVFDLSKTKNYEFNSECIRGGLVNKGMVYGKNGCGKSNLGLAIFDLVSHLTDKEYVAFHPFYLHADLPEETAKFRYVFSFDGNVVEYIYEKKAVDQITYERLMINKEEVVNYRIGSPLITTLKGTESLKKDISESKISSLKYIKANAVLNSDETNRVLNQFFDFVDNMLFFRSVENFAYIGYEKGQKGIFQDIIEKNHVTEFEQLLNEAGVSCKLSVIDLNGQKDIAISFENTQIRFWDIASSGSKILALFYFWLQRLDTTGVSLVFIDEFDANYHYELSQLVVKKLKKTTAQVILTTHNTSLMTNELMRPDCYFLMESGKITPFCDMTEKELRFAHNIEKMYRAGAFNG